MLKYYLNFLVFINAEIFKHADYHIKVFILFFIRRFMKTKLLTISFLIVLIVVAAVAVVFEAKPVDAQITCFEYALTSCDELIEDGNAWAECAAGHYYQCNNPYVMPDTIRVIAD